MTSDYIIDEILTLLKVRREYKRAIEMGKKLFNPQLCSIYYLSKSDIINVWDIFKSFTDKEWSFTDCSSKFVMEKLEISLVTQSD
jgi:uncharacterized protein